MKKVLLVLLILIMCFAIFSCDNQGNVGTDDPVDPVDPVTPAEDLKPVGDVITYEFKTFSIKLPEGLTTTIEAEDEFDELGFILSCPHYEFKNGDKVVLSIDIGGIGDASGEHYVFSWGQGFACYDVVCLFPEEDLINWADYYMLMYSDVYTIEELKELSLTIEPIYIEEVEE